MRFLIVLELLAASAMLLLVTMFFYALTDDQLGRAFANN